MTRSGESPAQNRSDYVYNVEPLIDVSGNLWMGFMKLLHLLQV